MSYRVEKSRHNRVSLACDNCRKKKTRCDAIKPACGRCAEYGYKCVYSPSERQSSSDTRFSAIHERLDQYGEILQSLVTSVNELVARNAPPPAIETPATTEISSEDKAFDLENSTHEIPLFNERLAHMKLHASGDHLNTSEYLSSVFLSILSPKDISSLSRMLEDPFLPQSLEMTSHNVWLKTQAIYGRLMEPSDESSGFQPDPRLLQVGIKAYRHSSNQYIHPLLPPDDLDFNEESSLPEPLSKGVKAALIIAGSFELRLQSRYDELPKQFVESQERAALYQAIRTLNLMRFSRPSFCSVRLAILLVFLLAVTSNIPSLMTLLGPIIDMCKVIKLDRPESNKAYPPNIAGWRERVWYLLWNLTYSNTVIWSLKPSGLNFNESDLLQSSFSQSEMAEQYRLAKYAIRIHRLYDTAYEKLFVIMSRKCSSKEVLNDILNLSKALTTWENEFPWDAHKLNDESLPNSFGDFVTTFSRGNLVYKFLHTVIAVYSIPAFYPSFLPEPVPYSLEKVSIAARTLYRIALSSQDIKGECTTVNSIAVTAAVCTLLYKQLCHPTHASNKNDLDLLSNTIHRLNQNRWPSVSGQSPNSEIWQALLDIMARHYQLHNAVIPKKSILENPVPNDWNDLFPHEYIEGNDQCVVT